jgi:hypothetical protein
MVDCVTTSVRNSPMADVARNCHFRPINTRHNLTDRVFQLGNLRLQHSLRPLLSRCLSRQFRTQICDLPLLTAVSTLPALKSSAASPHSSIPLMVDTSTTAQSGHQNRTCHTTATVPFNDINCIAFEDTDEDLEHISRNGRLDAVTHKSVCTSGQRTQLSCDG